MFSLKSVGIDIGSSTSHLIFSLITLRREGASLSGKFRVTNREVLYRSPIMLTPYTSATKIDTDKVNDFIHRAYKEAGLTPEDVDTGAVIITGEALKKENAQPIVENFAKYSGKFICAAAGHNHEALLAAYGCGAVDLSKSEHKTVLNVDMGGGTTKFSLVEDGVVSQTGVDQRWRAADRLRRKRQDHSYRGPGSDDDERAWYTRSSWARPSARK